MLTNLEHELNKNEVKYIEKVESDEQIKRTKYQKGKNKEKWNEHMLTTLEHKLNPRNDIKDYLVQCQMKKTKPNRYEIMALYNTIYIVKNNHHCHFKFQKHAPFLNV